MASKTTKASIIIGGAISGSFRVALTDTKSGLKRIGDEILNIEKRQRSMGRRVEDLAKMGKGTSAMRAGYAALGREADRLRLAQERLYKSEKRIADNRARRQEIGGKLRGATATLGAVVAATFLPIRDAVAFETAMLGVAKQVDGARDAGGRLTPVYFGMRKEILKLGRELPITTNGIADLVTAGSRMGIAQDQLIEFARTSAMMSTAFELPEGELAESMGKVAGIFKIPIPAIAELGDAINSLDDGSAARGGDIIRVLQGDLAGAASTMGLSAKNAAALASTFLTLGESAERADTAAAGMMRQLQVAKMNPKRFQVGARMLGLSGDQLQKGMVNDPQAMILDVLTRIKKLPVEEQMEAVTRLFGKDWGGAIAKLANGVDEYRKQIDIANGAAARGSMGREFTARMDTTAAKWQIAKNRIKETSIAIGTALTPAVNSFMDAFNPMAERFADFTAKNPGVVRGVIGTALALSGLRVAGLGVAYAWTAIKTPVLSVMGFIARFRAAGAIGSLGRFGTIAMRVAGVVRTVGMAIAAIGGGPIALAVGTLAAGALVVRKYWEPIKAYLGGVFDGIRAAVGPAMTEIGAALAPLKPVWDGIANAIGKVWDWFGKLLAPINMTSAELEGAASAGRKFGVVIGMVISNGLRGFAALVRVIGWVIGKAAAINGIVAKIPVIGTHAKIAQDLFSAPEGKRGPSTRGKAPPAVPASSARAGAATTDASTHHYNITQQPGESGEALAKRIEAERKRREGVDSRSRLADAA